LTPRTYLVSVEERSFRTRGCCSARQQDQGGHHKEIWRFELTEAFQKRRRRDEEYRREAARKKEGRLPKIEKIDRSEEAEAATPAIAQAIEKKAKKHSYPAPHLLVYVNFFVFSETSEPPITSLVALQLADQWGK
jgi:hypothetical protein